MRLAPRSAPGPGRVYSSLRFPGLDGCAVSGKCLRGPFKANGTLCRWVAVGDGLLQS